MKKKRIVLLAVLLVFVLVFSLGALVACGGDDEYVPQPNDNYELKLSGIGTTPIIVTKGEIKQLYNDDENARVEYTSQNPCYASDKTDSNNQKIPHTAKGVKFSAIIEKFVPDVELADVSSIEICSTDHYSTIITGEDFNGESPMIIAFEYDGKVLDAKSKSGELRVIINNRPAATWGKKINEMVLSSETLVPPVPTEFSFIENYNTEENLSVFDKTVTTDDGSETTTYKGVSIRKLIELGAVAAIVTDKMYVTAWDYKYTGTSEGYVDFISYKTYKNFIDASLVFYQQENGQFVPVDNSPELNSPAYQKGMNVKNVLSISASGKAVISFKMANSKFNLENANGGIPVEALLKHINMWKDGGSYVLTLNDNSTKEFTGAEIETAKIIDADGVISLNIGNYSYAFKKLAAL